MTQRNICIKINLFGFLKAYLVAYFCVIGLIFYRPPVELVKSKLMYQKIEREVQKLDNGCLLQRKLYQFSIYCFLCYSSTRHQTPKPYLLVKCHSVQIKHMRGLGLYYYPNNLLGSYGHLLHLQQLSLSFLEASNLGVPPVLFRSKLLGKQFLISTGLPHESLHP